MDDILKYAQSILGKNIKVGRLNPETYQAVNPNDVYGDVGRPYTDSETIVKESRNILRQFPPGTFPTTSTAASLINLPAHILLPLMLKLKNMKPLTGKNEQNI